MMFHRSLISYCDDDVPNRNEEAVAMEQLAISASFKKKNLKLCEDAFLVSAPRTVAALPVGQILLQLICETIAVSGQ